MCVVPSVVNRVAFVLDLVSESLDVKDSDVFLAHMRLYCFLSRVLQYNVVDDDIIAQFSG